MNSSEKAIRTVRCQCGKVELTTTGQPILTTACHCSDCSEGSRKLEPLPNAPVIRDSFGGTPHLLFHKKRVNHSRGSELLKNIQVEDDSPKRVYASCCNSYLYMDLPNPMQWMPIHTKRFLEPVPPLEMRINFKREPSTSAPTDVPTYSSVPPRFIFKMLGSLFTGSRSKE